MSKSGESSDSSNFYKRNNMPNVNGKKFPYTKKGIAEAKKAKEQKRTNYMHGGKVKDAMPKAKPC